MSNIVYCTCGVTIPNERVDLGYKRCVSCASKTYVKPKGVMIWEGKTAPVLQILTTDQFSDHRRLNPYGRNTGRGSGLHRVTKTTSSI